MDDGLRYDEIDMKMVEQGQPKRLDPIKCKNKRKAPNPEDTVVKSNRQ